MTIADRAKLFAQRLGEDQGNEDENAAKPSKFGVTVRKVTPDMADRLDIPSGKGVIVQDVKPDRLPRTSTWPAATSFWK